MAIKNIIARSKRRPKISKGSGSLSDKFADKLYARHMADNKARDAARTKKINDVKAQMSPDQLDTVRGLSGMKAPPPISGPPPLPKRPPPSTGLPDSGPNTFAKPVAAPRARPVAPPPNTFAKPVALNDSRDQFARGGKVSKKRKPSKKG